MAHRLGLNLSTVSPGRGTRGPSFGVREGGPLESLSTIAIEIGSVQVFVNGTFDSDVLRAVVDALLGGEQ